MEKAMAPHSSTLAWRIPGTEEPGGLPSMGSHRVGHDWSDLAAAAADKYYKAAILKMFKELNKTMFEKLKYGNNWQIDNLKRQKF